MRMFPSNVRCGQSRSQEAAKAASASRQIAAPTSGSSERLFRANCRLVQCNKLAWNKWQGCSLDHFVGSSENRWGDGEAKRFCSFDVQSHFEFGWHLNREIRRLCATENAIGIGRGTM